MIRLVPLKGFICYPRNDAESVERLEVHLTPISLEFGIEFWKDRKIDVGEGWHPTIQQRITGADVFIVVITPDFFNSAYIQSQEWPNIVAQARSRDVLIVPAILRPCIWQQFVAANGNLQATPLHPDTRRLEPALSSRWAHEEGLFQIAEDVRRAIVNRFKPISTWTGPQSSTGLQFVANTEDKEARYAKISHNAGERDAYRAVEGLVRVESA